MMRREGREEEIREKEGGRNENILNKRLKLKE